MFVPDNVNVPEPDFANAAVLFPLATIPEIVASSVLETVKVPSRVILLARVKLPLLIFVLPNGFWFPNFPEKVIAPDPAVTVNGAFAKFVCV